MEERRSTDRREGDRRSTRFGPGRRAADRRNGGSLVSSEAVRRVFPIAEGGTPPWLRRREALQRGALIVADLAAVALLLVLAPAGVPATSVLVGLAGTVGLAKIGGLYDGDTMVMRRSTLDESPRLAQVAGLVTLACGLAFASELSRPEVILVWGALTFTLLATRALARWLARRALAPERCLAIGDPGVAAHLRRKIADSRANAILVATLPLAAHEHADRFGGAEGLR